MIVIDTNILVYAHREGAGLHLAARRAIEMAASPASAAPAGDVPARPASAAGPRLL